LAYSPLTCLPPHTCRHPDLQRAMYSLLALLPQSLAFKTLHTRLSSTPPLAMMSINEQQQGKRGSGGGSKSSNWADFAQLKQVSPRWCSSCTTMGAYHYWYTRRCAIDAAAWPFVMGKPLAYTCLVSRSGL
jgi:hypothetical protein